MDTLKEIERRAAERHGGAKALEALLPKTKSARSLTRLGDDRYLSEMTRVVFQAGFVWRVVEAKWKGFEAVFSGFEPKPLARLSEKQLAKLASDKRIIRNPQKIRAVRENAKFLLELADEHKSAARFFARWPVDDIVGLWDVLKRRGSRLGGASGPMFLRNIGKDTPMLSGDVVVALREQGVIAAKNPASKAALRAVQEAFNSWRDESGRDLAQISRILACSVGEVRVHEEGHA